MVRTKLCSDHRSLLFLILGFFLTLSADPVKGANLPCAARQAGYICVCNNTYCDTIERPKALKSGHFYHYTTSATQPGFNLETGSFTASDSSNSSVKFVVDASQTYQTFRGVGGGLSDSSAINFNILSKKLQNKFLQSFFGVKGLEYVFGRVPLGASDFSTRFYTYDDVPGDVDLTHFQLVDEDLKLRIPMIKRARKVSKRGLQLFASPWTAPSWMKVNNDTTHSFLRREYESVYAQYLVRYLEEYKKQGVDFWGNEILMGFEARFQIPNMVLMPPQMKTWTRDFLGPLMRSEFPDVKIITVDDERPYLPWFSRELLDDEDIEKYVDGAALHWYMDSPDNTNILDDFYTKYPGKLLIYTESSIVAGGAGPHPSSADSSGMGSWSNAERYITNIMQNYNHFVSGYVDWNICLNEQGGPYRAMPLDPSVVVNTTTGNEFYKQPFFYALGHFSKFLPPGSQRINVTSDQNSTYSNFLDDFVMDMDAGVPTPPGPPPTGQPKPGPGPHPTSAPSTELVNVAAVNPDGSHVFIVYNPRSESVDITISDKQKGTITKTLGAQSLNTFLYW